VTSSYTPTGSAAPRRGQSRLPAKHVHSVVGVCLDGQRSHSTTSHLHSEPMWETGPVSNHALSGGPADVSALEFCFAIKCVLQSSAPLKASRNVTDLSTVIRC
jgi:hypothetical protein